MSDRDSLLATILAEPDEDTPRLVYADWLDEHAEPERAEFIRIQHRLPGLSRRTAEAKRLIARETELRKRLFQHLDKLPFAKITFRRGFVDSVTSSPRVFGKITDTLRAEDAPAFELILQQDEEEEGDGFFMGDFARLAKRSELCRCISLELPFLHSEPGARLLASPHLTGLRRLRAYGDFSDVFDDFDSPTFANLRWLNLSDTYNNDSHPPEMDRLINSRHLVNLEYLDLGNCCLCDDQLKTFTATAQLQRLQYLDISGCGFRDELVRFFHASSLPALTELDLSDSIGWWGRPASEMNECLELLADSPRIERLTKLELRRNGITDEGALSLAESPRKLQLTHLDLWDNKISAAAKQALKQRFGRGVCTYTQPKSS